MRFFFPPLAWLLAASFYPAHLLSIRVSRTNRLRELRIPPLRYTSQVDLRTDAPIIIVTGFVAATAEGVPTTLKRSGSDYSATIFARLMKVDTVGGDHG